MSLIVITIALLSQGAGKPPPRSCPANFLELAERIGELRADYPEFRDFVASEAFKPGSSANGWPSITFERGVSRVTVPGKVRRTKLVMQGRHPIFLRVGFISPVEIEEVATTPDGLVLGWYYRVSVEARDKARTRLIYSDVGAEIQSYEDCPQPERTERDAGQVGR